MSSRWFKRGPTARDIAKREASERSQNTRPKCMGDNYEAVLCVGLKGRTSYRRCRDCFCPIVGQLEPWTEEERLLIEWEFERAKLVK